MQRLIWTGCALLGAFWTLLAVVAHALTDWALQAVATGSPGNLATQAAESPITQWLTPWLGAEAVTYLQNSMLTLAGWLHTGLPAMGALDAWITPLIWIVWGIGTVLLVLGALLLCWAFKHTPEIGQLRRRQLA
ncbi:hypothetical protein [Viridibacterium curvum]|uniref:Uncharacterized protein n=1 Tax=Viridibacterium curvum TaxID=1101404 RepID=A0ABP9QP47_9RHOO